MALILGAIVALLLVVLGLLIQYAIIRAAVLSALRQQHDDERRAALAPGQPAGHRE